MRRASVLPVQYDHGEETIDPECRGLCDALNSLTGIETISSCCGHGFAPFRIYFEADRLEDLTPLLLAIDESEVWRMRVSMASGGSGIYFALDGSQGEALFAGPVADLAKTLWEHNATANVPAASEAQER